MSAPPRPPAVGATPKGKAAPARAQGTHSSGGAVPDPSKEQQGHEDSPSEYYSSYSESQSSEAPAQEEEKAPGPAGPEAPREGDQPRPSGARAPRSPPVRQRSPRRSEKERNPKASDQTQRARNQATGKNRIVQVLHDGPPAHQPDIAAGGGGQGPRRGRS